MASLTDDC